MSCRAESIAEAVHGVTLKIKNFLTVQHIYPYYCEINWDHDNIRMTIDRSPCIIVNYDTQSLPDETCILLKKQMPCCTLPNILSRV
jgi:hypothetical protein